MKKTLILDLDDTIFETRSMDPTVFEPFFTHLTNALKRAAKEVNHEQAVADLWCMTWDAMIQKHGIHEELFFESIKVLDSTEMDLQIKPYPDYIFLKRLPHPKFLVTTSLTSLQEKKINALGIGNDFERIIINDRFKRKRDKKDIFSELVNEFKLEPANTYVIGDNEESEIKAGNELGMVTIQMLRPNVRRGENARHFISSFEDLEKILGFSISE